VIAATGPAPRLGQPVADHEQGDHGDGQSGRSQQNEGHPPGVKSARETLADQRAQEDAHPVGHIGAAQRKSTSLGEVRADHREQRRGLHTQGTLHLELTKGEVELHAGDVVIQHGTRHAWRNRSDQVAKLLVVFVGAAAPSTPTS
jgi:cupin domain